MFGHIDPISQFMGKIWKRINLNFGHPHYTNKTDCKIVHGNLRNNKNCKIDFTI